MAKAKQVTAVQSQDDVSRLAQAFDAFRDGTEQSVRLTEALRAATVACVQHANSADAGIELVVAFLGNRSAAWVKSHPRPAGKTDSAEYKAWHRDYVRDFHNPARVVKDELVSRELCNLTLKMDGTVEPKPFVAKAPQSEQAKADAALKRALKAIGECGDGFIPFKALFDAIVNKYPQMQCAYSSPVSIAPPPVLVQAQQTQQAAAPDADAALIAKILAAVKAAQ